MEWSTIVEVFGYLASLTVVFSLTRTSVKKLWTINMIGGIGFIIYAMITKSYPTALMNLGAVIIDIVQLYRLSHVKDSFELVEADRDSAYYQWFKKNHHDDLADFCPDLAYEKAEKLFYYLRNNEVAGLLAFNQHNSEAEIVLDYVTPKFRDCKIGHYFFGKESHFLKDNGIHELITRTSNARHITYLKQMQFHPMSNNAWVKTVSP